MLLLSPAPYGWMPLAAGFPPLTLLVSQFVEASNFGV